MCDREDHPEKYKVPTGFYIGKNGCSKRHPDKSAAEIIRFNFTEEGNFTSEAVVDIMGEEKKSELDTVTIKNEILRKYFPRSYTPKQMEEKIIQLLDAWQRNSSGRMNADLYRNERPDGVFFFCIKRRNAYEKQHYPFAYVHSEKDILKLVTTLMTNTKGEGSGGDPFWEKSERLLLTALIAYLHYEAPVEEQNFATLLEMLNTMQVLEDDEEYQNPVDLLFEELAKKKPNSFAGRQYKLYKLAAGDICSK